MFKQEDLAFPKEIQKYGCYFFCLLRMAEIESGKELTREQIIEIYHDGRKQEFNDWQGVKRTWIEDKCSIANPDAICLRALMLLGSKKKIRQVGSLTNGRPTFWPWANRSPWNDPEYVALKFQTRGEIGHHYALADAMQEVIFDPSVTDYTRRPVLGGLLHKVVG